MKKEETLFKPINKDKNRPKFNKKRNPPKSKHKKSLFVHPYLRHIRKRKRFIYKQMAFFKKIGPPLIKRSGLVFITKIKRGYRPKIHVYRPYGFTFFRNKHAREARVTYKQKIQRYPLVLKVFKKIQQKELNKSKIKVVRNNYQKSLMSAFKASLKTQLQQKRKSSFNKVKYKKTHFLMYRRISFRKKKGTYHATTDLPTFRTI